MKHVKVIVLASFFVCFLTGCAAAGKVFMSGYTPPKTIADILREQEGLPETSISKGVSGQADAALTGRRSSAISMSEYRADQKKEHSNERSEQSEQEFEASRWVQNEAGFRPSFTHKTLQDYAAQLTMELLKNSRGLYPSDTIGIASFVILDNTLNTHSVLGNQISEYFINEMHQLGMGVIDFKVMDQVVVSNRGDFAFSRESKRLAQENNMSHILSGTLINKPNGTQLNARIVSLQNKNVVATGSLMIPRFVADSLFAMHY